MNRRKIPTTKIFFLLLIIALGVFGSWRVFRTPAQYTNESSSILSGLLSDQSIPPIDQPKFESVRVADGYLNNDGMGIATSVKGNWRFYPYQLLVWHQIVNDVIQGVPLLVSYDPLSYSGAVFRRTVRGEPARFSPSDKMQNSQVLLFDKGTKSLWNITSHLAIEGELNGEQLVRYPYDVMSWDSFKRLHSEGEVLSRQTGFERDYTHDPYGNYHFDDSMLFPVTRQDDRLYVKRLVFGIEWNDLQKAYILDDIKSKGEVRDTIGNTPIVITYEEKTGMVKSFILDSSQKPAGEIIGTVLYWFAWVNAFPQTALY